MEYRASSCNGAERVNILSFCKLVFHLVCDSRLASRKFMHEAIKFAQFAKDQMGVKIFMLAGWKNDTGVTKKAK
jgi:hypothetical protein